LTGGNRLNSTFSFRTTCVYMRKNTNRKFLVFCLTLACLVYCNEQSIVDLEVDLPDKTSLPIDGQYDLYPDWHPNRQKLIFLAFDPSLKNALENDPPVALLSQSGDIAGIVKEYDLATLKTVDLIDKSHQPLYCRYSPSGDTIVYCRRGEKSTEIWTYDMVKKSHARIFAGGRNAFLPQWSPNGKHIAVLSDQSLMILNAQGFSVEQQIDTGLTVHSFTWHPLENRIIFSASSGDEFYLYEYDLEHNSTSCLSDCGLEAVWPDMSMLSHVGPPFDGPQLAFQEGDDIFVTPLPEVSLIETIVNGRTPSWSPDGRKLVYSQNGHIEIETIWIDIND
jgi:WD40 repeat protein